MVANSSFDDDDDDVKKEEKKTYLTYNSFWHNSEL